MEIYNPYSIVQVSEVLSELTVRSGERSSPPLGLRLGRFRPSRPLRMCSCREGSRGPPSLCCYASRTRMENVMGHDSSDQIAHERRVHAIALELLGEVRDYLQRLPVVPATRGYARRIDEFLTNRDHAAVNRLAEEQIRLDGSWEGGAYSASGSIALFAEIRDSTLLLAGTDLASMPLAKQEATIAPGSRTYPAMSLPLEKAEAPSIHILPRER